MRLKNRRLFAVMAMVAAMLVPAAMASAGGGGGVDDHECDEDHYSALNPQHILYGRTQGTPVVDGKMQVDASGMGSGVVIFWDQHFSTGSDGAVILGTNFADVICGTWGSDEIWGLQGNDRIFGMGSGDGDDSDYDPLIAGSGDRLFGNKGHDFITPGYGTGLGDMNGDYAALTGGGRGNDTIYAGNGDLGTLARGGLGNDEIFGGVSSSPDDQVLRGGDGDDVLHGNGGDRSMLFGSLGDDILNGGWGDDQDLSGNRGNDTLNGGSGDYHNLYGGMGDDTLTAHTSGDFQALFGGQGNDFLTGLGGSGGQLADGGPGDDVIHGAGPTSIHAFGGGGNDSIIGGSGSDWLFGDYANAAGQVAAVAIRDFAPAHFIQPGVAGDDYIEGRGGADDIYGGPGNDWLYGNMPKTTNPNIGLDISDGDFDELFGDDGDDTIFGSGTSCPGDNDDADGGANFAAGDSSWGLSSATDTVNVENHNDEAPGCVTP